ncbi:MAG: hypothetical protein M1562_02075, partial [Candidatus Marsarchaeota archaeon]|nr:hypothetical protein [Candidatus Marsarchaeota archaeon]
MHAKHIFIDTSSILFAIENRKDIFEIIDAEFDRSYIRTVSNGVIGELRRIGGNRSERGGMARAAIQMISDRSIHIDRDSKRPDVWMLKISGSASGDIFITNDTALLRSIRAKGARVFRVSRYGISGKYQT